MESSQVRNVEGVTHEPWYTKPRVASDHVENSAVKPRAGVINRTAGLVDTLASHLRVEARTVDAKERVSGTGLDSLDWVAGTDVVIEAANGVFVLRRWYGEPLVMIAHATRIDTRSRLGIPAAVRADAGIRAREIVLPACDLTGSTCTVMAAAVPASLVGALGEVAA